jgi:hypothetical protein
MYPLQNTPVAAPRPSQGCFVNLSVLTRISPTLSAGVGIIVDPGKQPSSRLVRIDARGLPGFDPEADQILSELPETAARIVELIGLRMASGEERLIERDGSCRLRCGDLPDVGRNLLQADYE